MRERRKRRKAGRKEGKEGRKEGRREGGREEGKEERKEGRATSGLRPSRTPLLRTDPLSLSFWPFVSTFTWHFLKGDKTGDEHSTSDFSLKKRKCHAEKREQISRGACLKTKNLGRTAYLDPSYFIRFIKCL